MTGARWIATYRGDVEFYYGVDWASPAILLKAAANPSVVAAQLFRASSQARGVCAVLIRWVLLLGFASDVAAGASFLGPIRVPHPTGIVIGKGSVIGGKFTIFQNVTVGRSLSGKYPTIGSGVTLYSGCVIFGDARIAPGSSIGANMVVGGGRARV